jgi:hypothetical protein
MGRAEEIHEESEEGKREMTWELIGVIAGIIAILGFIYGETTHKLTRQLAMRAGRFLENKNRKVLDAVQGNRDVNLEYRVDAHNVLRNRATIDREGRILKLYSRQGPWQVGDKLTPGDYRETDQF